MANNPTQSDSSSSSGSGSSSDSSSSSSNSSYSSSSSDEEEEHVPDHTKYQLIQAKSEYRRLKFNLLQSIKENEILVDELRKHQKKLVRLNRDKYFLFERLLAYEKPPPKQNSSAKEKKEKIEMVDGIPTVVKSGGKKRGPKPGKKKSDVEHSLLAAALEPGSSLLRLKANSISGSSGNSGNPSPPASGGRKRGPKKNKEGKLLASSATNISATPDSNSMSPSSSSNAGAITFSPGFSKTKMIPNLKRQNSNNSKSPNKKSNKSNKNGPSKKSRENNSSYMCQEQQQPQHHQNLLHQSELSNSTTEDTVMSYPSDSGGPPAEFFRQDSFSQEMPDNLFDD